MYLTKSVCNWEYNLLYSRASRCFQSFFSLSRFHLRHTGGLPVPPKPQAEMDMVCSKTVQRLLTIVCNSTNSPSPKFIISTTRHCLVLSFPHNFLYRAFWLHWKKIVLRRSNSCVFGGICCFNSSMITSKHVS